MGILQGQQARTIAERKRVSTFNRKRSTLRPMQATRQVLRSNDANQSTKPKEAPHSPSEPERREPISSHSRPCPCVEADTEPLSLFQPIHICSWHGLSCVPPLFARSRLTSHASAVQVRRRSFFRPPFPGCCLFGQVCFVSSCSVLVQFFPRASECGPPHHLPHSAFSASKCPLSSRSQILCLQHSRNMILCCLENGLASVFDSNVLYHTNLASHSSFVSSFVTQFFGCTFFIEALIRQHRCFSGIMGSGRVVTHYF